MDPDIDPDRIDDAVLALLWLGRHDGGWRTWKGFVWTPSAGQVRSVLPDRLIGCGFVSGLFARPTDRWP
jgi:hypothetical protein